MSRRSLLSRREDKVTKEPTQESQRTLKSTSAMSMYCIRLCIFTEECVGVCGCDAASPHVQEAYFRTGARSPSLLLVFSRNVGPTCSTDP